MKKKSTTVKLGPGVSVRMKRDRFYIRFYDPTRRSKEKMIALVPIDGYSTKATTDRTVALHLARSIYAEYVREAFDPWQHQAVKEAVVGVTIEDALGRYLKENAQRLRPSTLRDQRFAVPMFARLAGVVYLDEIRPDHIHNVIYREGLKVGSQSSYLGKISTFLSWCVEKGYISENPASSVKSPGRYETIPKGMSEDELAFLLRSAVEHVESLPRRVLGRMQNLRWFRDAADLMAWTGLRPGEARRLRWSDIEWPTTDLPGAIIVRHTSAGMTKTGEERTVTMLPQAMARLEYLLIETRLSDDPEECVLKGADGKGPVSIHGLSRRFRIYRRECKLPEHYTLYSFRHTFATEYIRRGGSFRYLMEELGHKKPETTMRYAHASDLSRRRATFALFSDAPGHRFEGVTQ